MTIHQYLLTVHSKSLVTALLECIDQMLILPGMTKLGLCTQNIPIRTMVCISITV